MDISEEERVKIVMDAYLKMQPESRSDMFARTNDMSKLTDQDRLVFGLLKQMEEEIQRQDNEEIKKRVAEFSKQLSEEKRVAEEKQKAKEQQIAEEKQKAEEKRVSKIQIPGLKDLSNSRSRGGRKKNNKTKKHKK